jgi:hypothetical protein
LKSLFLEMQMTRQWLRSVFALLALGSTAGLTACGDDNPANPGVPMPTGLTATPSSITTIDLAWGAVTGATGYLLQRTSAATPGTFTAVSGGVIAATTYQDTVAGGVAYGYRVAAVNATDTSDFTAVVNAQTNLQTVTGNITTNLTMTADKVWMLSGYVKVQNGVTLTIEPGTRIIGDTSVPGSSLWILRGARIVANGTAAAPIVFTSARAAPNRKPGDWGGLVVIGRGIINRTGTGILTEGGAAGEAVDYSGGTDNTDSSGVLRYVRIEFAGYDVSGGAGQELNSLSMYAVGRRTVLEYVQTLAGLDDAFEWWGGAVDGRYLVSYETGDDHFDWTEGYQGRNQFLIGLQSTRLAAAAGAGGPGSDPRGFEGDGCDPGTTGCTVSATSVSTPYSMPVFANFTMIGPGTAIAGYPGDGNGGTWRRGTGGQFHNGVLARWRGIAINIRDAWTDTLLQQRDSLNIVSVILAQNGGNYDSTSNFGQAAKFAADNHVVRDNTVLVDTLLGINLNPAALDWTPKAGSPAATDGVAVGAARVAGYFGGTWVNTGYRGAADPTGPKWWAGWTSYSIN